MHVWGKNSVAIEGLSQIATGFLQVPVSPVSGLRSGLFGLTCAQFEGAGEPGKISNRRLHFVNSRSFAMRRWDLRLGFGARLDGKVLPQAWQR